MDPDTALAHFTNRELLTELAERMEQRLRPRSTPVAQLGRVCRSSLTVLAAYELDAHREDAT